MRNRYAHLNEIDDTKKAKKDAKIVINNLISILNIKKEHKTFLKNVKIEK